MFDVFFGFYPIFRLLRLSGWWGLGGDFRCKEN